MEYINSTYETELQGWVGDDIQDICPHIYADADFAGDLETQRSTSGMHYNFEGPNTRFPLPHRVNDKDVFPALPLRQNSLPPLWL